MINERDENILLDIITRCKRIIEKNKGISYEEFCLNYDIIDIVCFNLIQIGELGNKLSLEFKSLHKGEDWKSMIGMKNRMVHGYTSIDFETVFDTMNKDIPRILDYCLSLTSNKKS